MKHAFPVRATLATSAALLATMGVTSAAGSASAHQESSAAAQARPDRQPSEARIAALFDRWNAALLTRDSARVTALYAHDAVLLPTVSPRIRTNHAEIADYFDHFLEKKPVGEKVRSVITVLDENSAIDAGLYRFTLTEKDGTKTTVDARYTYAYEKIRGRWLIVNHHSSVLPAAG
ncbi:SgcJ/EcaC family oxidoreductase [Streptomyces katsurahamanus]|uniref:SgcJ/EcaC family oxidoreductase n=1 Tax=Streptomyces katsurahamanus TaxID=2577098 RepID=A0ABW9NS63_9ACTN|nr:SgcJ/EcaC family oxidoreductase [Streptomyces katsurahamanus]MQS36121.1 SgcJ/EcaC family oxidoreductase [Streptomyces katsurahamanus]